MPLPCWSDEQDMVCKWEAYLLFCIPCFCGFMLGLCRFQESYRLNLIAIYQSRSGWYCDKVLIACIPHITGICYSLTACCTKISLWRNKMPYFLRILDNLKTRLLCLWHDAKLTSYSWYLVITKYNMTKYSCRVHRYGHIRHKNIAQLKNSFDVSVTWS